MPHRVVRPFSLKGGISMKLFISVLIIMVSIAAIWASPAIAENYALYFDGSNDYLISEGVLLEISDQLTLEAWFKPIDQNSGFGKDIIGKRELGRREGNFNLHWYGYQAIDSVSFVVKDEGCHSPQGAIDSDLWHHVAGVYDGSEMRLYLNGSLVSSVAYTGPIENVATDLCIGGKSWNSSYRYLGTIDEVRVWNVARSIDEIRETMNRELYGDETGLIGYWNFNSGSGAIAYDKSADGNDCSLVGPPDWVISSAPIISISDDKIPPTGSVHAYPNLIFPPNNQMITIVFNGYVMDEASILRDGGDIGVSLAYVIINGSQKIILRDGPIDKLGEYGKFEFRVDLPAIKNAEHVVELFAADTNPIVPNFGLVDDTTIRVYSPNK